MRSSTNRIVLMGLLVSLSIVLTRIFSVRIALGNVEGIRIGLGTFPIVVAGIWLGPVAGGLVGMLADVVGYFINPVGAYMPHFTLTAALHGIIPVTLLRLLPEPRFTQWKFGLALAISEVTTSVILVPYFLNVLFGLPLAATVPAKLISCAITVPLYATMLNLLLKRTEGLIHIEAQD